MIESNLQEIRAPQETESAYRQLVEQSLQGISIHQDERIVFCNPAAAEQLGYSVAEMLALDSAQVKALVHPDDFESVAARERSRAKGKTVPAQYVFQALRRDGSARWLEASTSQIEHRGQPGLLVITMDITERKAAQDAMQLTMQRTRLREETIAALTRGESDLNAVLQHLARVVGALLGDLCVATLRSTDGKWVEPLAYSHANPERQPLVDQMYAGLRLPYDHPILGEVFTKAQAIIIPQLDRAMLERNPVPQFAAFIEGFGIASYLVVPMVQKGEVIGSLGVIREQGGIPYTLDDQYLLQELADRAALAISNAQLVEHLQCELEDARAEQAQTRSEYETLEREHARTQAQLEAKPQGSAVEQEQRAFAEALGDAAALLNRAPDVSQVLDGLLDTVARIVPYETASIFMRDGAVLRLARARGFDKYELEEWVRGVTFPADLPKFRTMVEQRTPLFIPDTGRAPGWVQLEQSNWIRSHVSAPLRFGGDTVGMIGLDATTPNFYNVGHAARLMTFADLAATAMRHAQLLSETQQRARQLSLLYDVGLTLNRVLDARTQLEFLFQIALRALRADNMSYFGYHARTGQMSYELGVGMSPETEATLRDSPFSVSEGAVGWIAEHRLPLLIPDVQEDARWVRKPEVSLSVVGVPVEHEKELRGVLMAGRKALDPFTAQDERLLILFANQVAAAMELTRLFQAQKQRQRELEILREASLAFAAATDRATLTTLILQFALRLVSAQNAFLFFYENQELSYGGMLWADDSPVEPQSFAPRRDGLTQTVAQTGKMLVIDDVNAHPLFESWRWGGAIIGLPLKAAGEVRAILNVAHEQPHPFAPDELYVLELFADQAAAALESARHYDETARQLRNAQLLHRAGEALSHNLSFPAAVEQLADFFIEALGVEVCCISTVDVAADTICVVVDRDPLDDSRLPSGTVGKLADHPHFIRLMREQRTLTFRADAPALDAILRANMERYHWCSLLVLPLFAGDELIGIVELADQHVHRDFSVESIRLAESLAHQAARALHTARLFQEMERRVEELQRAAAPQAGARTAL